MERTELPIAVFDSGLGGISVLRALVQRLPGEDFLYFGDSANAPYGVRPAEEVRRLTQDVIARLYDRGIKAAVIACNTATSAAIGPLRAAFPDIPVIGIEPALKPAVAHHRRVLVLATPLTLREEKFAALMQQCAGCAEITPLPCPELVEFVERGELDSPALTAYLARQLGTVWVNREREIFDSPDGKALLRDWGLPETLRGVGAVALGYAAGPAPEAAPRKENYIVHV